MLPGRFTDKSKAFDGIMMYLCYFIDLFDARIPGFLVIRFCQAQHGCWIRTSRRNEN